MVLICFDLIGGCLQFKHHCITTFPWIRGNTYRGLFVANIWVLLQKRNQRWSGLCGFFRLEGQKYIENMFILFIHKLHTLCSNICYECAHQFTVQRILTGELSMNIKSKWFTVSWNKKNTAARKFTKHCVRSIFDVLKKAHLCLLFAW